MRYVVRAVILPGAAEPATFAPDDPELFGVPIVFFLGPEGDDPRADAFDVLVCSPRWFAERALAPEMDELSRADPIRGGRVLFSALLGANPHAVSAVDGGTVIGGRGLLFMRRWDYAVLERAIVDWCAGIDAPDLASVSSRLARVMDWEFQHEYDEAIDRGEPFPRPSQHGSDGG